MPDARYVQHDMVTFRGEPASFDAAVAFASFGHVPRELHAGLYRMIADVLRPGGIFAGELPMGDNPDERNDDWFGAPMYWSHPDAEETLVLIEDAGLVVDETATVRGDDGSWLGVIARAPSG